MPADGIDLVDEHDTTGELRLAWSNRSRTGCAKADEHLYQTQSRRWRKRNARLAGNGLGHQRFAGAGSANQNNTFGNARPQSE